VTVSNTRLVITMDTMSGLNYETHYNVWYFSLPLRCSWILKFSGMLRSFGW